MKPLSSHIPCPVCHTGTITLLPQALLSGQGFSCGNCGATVRLEPSSRTALASGLQAHASLAAGRQKH